MTLALHLLVGLLGAALVGGTVLSAVRTVVLPRAVPVRLTRLAFLATAGPFQGLASLVQRLPGRDDSHAERALALYAPVTLLLLPALWLLGSGAGFTALLWAAEEGGVAHCLDLSGSSIVTLGTVLPRTPAGSVIGDAEAGVAISFLVLLLVTYLPSMYDGFRQREREVALIHAYAGSPPSGVELLVRAYRSGGLEGLASQWVAWQGWFVDLRQTHTSLAPLLLFRGVQADQGWVPACGAALDAAALAASVVDLAALLAEDPVRGVVPDVPGGETRPGAATRAQGTARWGAAELLVRVGGQSLVRLAESTGGVRTPAGPHLTREEALAACDRLAAAGLPVVADRDGGAADLLGWRQLYAPALLDLARLTRPPEAPWSSDRVDLTGAAGTLRASLGKR